MQSIVWQNIAAAPYASCHRCGLIRLCCMHNYWRGLESSGCVVVISIAVECLWLISLSKSSFFWSLLLWDQCAALCLPEGHTGPFTHTVVLHVHIDDVLYFKCTSLIVYISVFKMCTCLHLLSQLLVSQLRFIEPLFWSQQLVKDDDQCRWANIDLGSSKKCGSHC